MYSTSFFYAGIELVDFGFIICSFDGSSGSTTVSAGSKITFNTVPVDKGRKYSLTGTQYDECIQSTFSIAKNPCKNLSNEEMRITNDEYRDIMRWLNRREFLKFQIFDESDNTRDACYFNASFNVEKVLIGGQLYGLTLTMTTDKPFGYGEEQIFTFNITNTSNSYVLYDVSDEIGQTYPNITITCNESGNLILTNETEDCVMVINNCSKGEVITINGEVQIITSSSSSHAIYDDFNFEFFKIGNTYDNRENIITSTLPCTLEIKYTPIIKDTPE